jgi:phosphate transport system substrate-binding protein
MRMVFRYAAFVALGLCVIGPANAAERLRVAGTGVGVALVRALAESFKALHHGVENWVPDSVGTQGALRGLETGKLDVGFVLRPLKAGEVPGGRAVEICRTPLVFFASSSRRDITLSRSDLPALFSGSLAAYPGGEVRPLLRPPTDTGYTLMIGYFPELSEVVDKARERRGAVLSLTDQDAMDAVEDSRSLVSFAALAPILAERRRLFVVPFDGLDPSVEALAAGRYPYAAPLLLALGAAPSSEARAFVEFAQSPAARAQLRAQGCLPSTGGDR